MNFNTLRNCTKFAVEKSTVGSFYKENKFKPCLIWRLLNMFQMGLTEGFYIICRVLP